MTSAQRNMLVGGGICLVGIAITVFTYQAARPGGSYTVAYGAIAVGAIQFIYGLAKFIEQRNQPATDGSPAMLALHAMAYVASGDGQISDTELKAMNDILQRIAGRALPEGAASQLDEIARLPPHHAASFEKARTALSRVDREVIFKCAMMVALSDGEMAGAGAERVSDVGNALGLSAQDMQVVAHAISKVLAQNSGTAAAPG